jgi:hypothetical protein
VTAWVPLEDGLVHLATNHAASTLNGLVTDATYKIHCPSPQDQLNRPRLPGTDMVSGYVGIYPPSLGSCIGLLNTSSIALT